MKAIALNDIDPNNVFPADWLHRLEKYDLLSELVVLICKNRHIKEYAPLVDHIVACIEAEQGDLERCL